MLGEQCDDLTVPDADVTKLPILADQTGPLADRVYTLVKAAIMRLDFPPGAVIRKSDLCARLGLSRSPVTDALTKLSIEGLVDIVPQSSTKVSRLSMAAIRDDAFLREALEVAAARHAALSRSDDVLAKLKRNIEIHMLLIKDEETEELMRNDIAFHETIMSTTAVARLPAVVRTLSPNVDRARMLLMPEPGRLAETLREHIEIFEAIKARDPVAAEDAMRRHVRQLLRRLEPLESARPEVFSGRKQR